jgi:lysyl-tRNA synthetase class 1
MGLLLNLVGVMGAEATAERVWAYLSNYVEGAPEESYPAARRAGPGNALAYNRDFIAPTLKRRKPEENEARALAELDAQLGALSEDASAEDIQNIVYAIGKDPHYGFEQLRDWFKALYQTLLGADQGPRMGSFIALYGIENSRRLIVEALSDFE